MSGSILCWFYRVVVRKRWSSFKFDPWLSNPSWFVIELRSSRRLLWFFWHYPFTCIGNRAWKIFAGNLIILKHLMQTTKRILWVFSAAVIFYDFQEFWRFNICLTQLTNLSVRFWAYHSIINCNISHWGFDSIRIAWIEVFAFLETIKASI